MTPATTFGAVTVARVREWFGLLFTREQLLPDSDRRHWRDNASWLVPDFWSPDTEDAWTHSQSFVLTSGATTVLIDTGIGNAKPRPDRPPFNGPNTDYQQTMCEGGGMANATIIERL
jgi:hypothetical protein